MKYNDDVGQIFSLGVDILQNSVLLYVILFYLIFFICYLYRELCNNNLADNIATVMAYHQMYGRPALAKWSYSSHLSQLLAVRYHMRSKL